MSTEVSERPPQSSKATEVDRSYAYLENLYRRPIVPPATAELRRIHTLLALVGNPHLSFPSVHVTGTCGKGSTVTMIGSILTAAGYRAGVFRSPHLESYRERIAVGGEIVSEDDWLNAFQRVHAAAEEMEQGRVPGYDLGRISLFEMVWAMAALHYAEAGVDIVVAEVGIGGRLSPTNVLSPDVAVLTNVSLDHTSFLGPTEVDIAREKAQIIKSGSAAVTAATQLEVIEVIAERSRSVGADLWRVGSEVTVDVSRQDLRGEVLDIRTPARSHMGVSVGMLGSHQALNAATAVAAADRLSIGGMEIAETAIVAGIAQAHLPGRFEIVSNSPLIVLDGARNVASASVLAATLRHLFPDRPVTLLVGVLSDKDAEGIVEILGPLASTAVVTDPPWEGRLGDVSRLERALHAYLSNVSYVPNREEAFERARNATRDGGLVLVTGSLYLVAEVRRMILGSTA